METLFQSTQSIVFFTIAIVGFVWLLISQLFGGHDHDHDIHHDFDDTHGFSITNVFSPKILSVFAVSFGASGGIASVYDYSVLSAILIGLAFGVVIGAVMCYFLELINKQQANSLVGNDGLVGLMGSVITRIPENDMGQINFTAKGQSLVRLARDVNGKTIETGKSVEIVKVLGESLLVKEKN